MTPPDPVTLDAASAGVDGMSNVAEEIPAANIARQSCCLTSAKCILSQLSYGACVIRDMRPFYDWGGRTIMRVLVLFCQQDIELIHAPTE